MSRTEKEIRNRKMLLSYSGYCETEEQEAEENRKLSSVMAMLLGDQVTLEIMIAGAMILNIDVVSADILAIIFAFIVVYFGVVALLTDN